MEMERIGFADREEGTTLDSLKGMMLITMYDATKNCGHFLCSEAQIKHWGHTMNGEMEQLFCPT